MKWVNFRLPKALFLVAGAFVALVSWSNRQKGESIEVTALISVEWQPTNTVRLARAPTDYQAARREILASLKSDAVLKQCVDDNATRRLQLLEGVADPVTWLRQKLQIEPFNDSDVIAVGMQTTAIEAEQVRVLLFTLLNTFVHELGRKENQLLELQLQSLRTERDLLCAQIENLKLQLEKDWTSQVTTAIGQKEKRILTLNSELDYWKTRGFDLPRVRIMRLPLASDVPHIADRGSW